MFESGRQRRQPAPWLFVVAGWAVAIGVSVALLAIRAQHVRVMDPAMPFLMTPVWLTSLALISVGTFRLLHFVRDTPLRIFLAAVAVCAQCFAYFLLFVSLAVHIHLGAGGHL